MKKQNPGAEGKAFQTGVFYTKVLVYLVRIRRRVELREEDCIRRK